VMQSDNEGMNDAVKRKSTQCLLEEGYGLDKGVAMCIFFTAGFSCFFYDFETCEEIFLSHPHVRLLV
jgi:hypothetical protein